MTEVDHVDIAIVGAGPAGLAAASAALAARRQAGTSTTAQCTDPTASAISRILVIDAAEQPGGQFWRHRAESASVDDGRLHHDWNHYLALRAEFDAGRECGVLSYSASASVWMVERDAEGFTLHIAPSHGPGATETPVVRARTLILATGGYDRQIPIPGWDLPGVMAAGGIQGFAKQNGMLPGKRFVIAGTGPFLLPVAATISDLGGEVAAVLESANLTGWLPRAHRAAGVPGKAIEGAGYALTMAKNRISYRPRRIITEILGDDKVEAVRTERITGHGDIVAGSERTIEGIDTVGLGWGFTPQLELPIALGAHTRVDVDGSLIATVDADQRSSVPGLFLAGEITGVGGAGLAVAEGRIAGHVAAGEVSGRIQSAAVIAPDPTSARKRWDRSTEADPLSADRRSADRHRAFAEAMHLAHPVPSGWKERLDHDTTVCRCEEVTAGEIVAAKDSMSAEDSRTQKGVTRAGMGWCQGRVCGFAVSCLSGDGSGDAIAQTMKRPVAQPVPLSAFLEF